MEELQLDVIESQIRDDGQETVSYRVIPQGRPIGSKNTYSQISNFCMLRALESVDGGDLSRAKQYLSWVERFKIEGGINQGFDYEMLKAEANRSALFRLADKAIRKMRLPEMFFL
jgi:hypothetical protein